MKNLFDDCCAKTPRTTTGLGYDNMTALLVESFGVFEFKA